MRNVDVVIGKTIAILEKEIGDQNGEIIKRQIQSGIIQNIEQVKDLVVKSDREIEGEELTLNTCW